MAEDPLDKEKLSGLLQFQVERKFVFLSKGFLEILEGLLADHYITEEDFQSARKRILDKLGDTRREMADLFKQFRIDLV